MTRLSRRNFLTYAGGAFATSFLLKGCLGNPPGFAQVKEPVAPPDFEAAKTLETNTVVLGYLPILEAAPLIVASEKGFFAKYGMLEAKVAKQANWGSARDNVEIGSAGGGIDGGQWQMPMPYLIHQGLITKGKKPIPMALLLQLNTQANGIAIAGHLRNENLGLDLSNNKGLFSQLKSSQKTFKAAYTFPKANQEFWLRYWLAAGGIDPETEVELLTVPAAQTVANMKTGTMDAFSTGDPWPYRIVQDQVGYLSMLTAQMWPFHPEEYLALRADWIAQNPKATQAVLMAIMDAQRWCDDFANREELAIMLSSRNYFGTRPEVLRGPLAGTYDMGNGQVLDDPKYAPYYWQDPRGSVSYPYQSHDLWFLTESVRWGFLPPETLDRATEIIAEVNREDLWRQAAQTMGVPASEIPTSTSRGVETFFDGVTFDPKDPKAYLRSLEIKTVKI
jgi:bicarbonate transport system substrate-binding protein